MNLCSIVSGSSGNCTYIGNEDTHLLVDVGISKKKLEEGLKAVDVDINKISSILITHEHIDHISGLGVMMRKFGMKVYGTRETLMAAMNKGIGKVDTSLFHFIEPDKEFVINDITIHPFSISHDAANPVCYTAKDSKDKVSVATDLGKYDDYIIDNLKGSRAILIEANHDINMLEVGPYPYYLKQRILSDFGHLSNDNSGKLLTNLIDENLEYVYLGHLSKENNYPELAYETVRCIVKDNVSKESGIRTKLAVAYRDKPSMMV